MGWKKLRRLKTPDPTPKGPSTIVIAWFRDDAHYQAAKQRAGDPEAFYDHIDTWRAGAEDLERTLVAAGHPVARIELDLDSFHTWCDSRGYVPDAAARARFVGDLGRMADMGALPDGDNMLLRRNPPLPPAGGVP